MRRTYSWKRITDEQIADAFNGWPDESFIDRLATATGYPQAKCVLAIDHAMRRGLIEFGLHGPYVNTQRIRSCKSL